MSLANTRVIASHQVLRSATCDRYGGKDRAARLVTIARQRRSTPLHRPDSTKEHTMYPRRRPLTLTLVLLLALVASAAALGGRDAPAAQAQVRPRIVYVYDHDAASRDSFKTMLELRGYDVTTVTTATVTLGQVNWANVQAVL